ncbi:MAG: polysaccharide deacetylase family protein [Candidatus Nealsonbacteria bacterium]
MKNKTCFVSVDVERDQGGGESEFKGIENLDRILDIFKKYDVLATLFVTGEVLERYGDLVKKLSGNYEIACHGYTHRFWSTLDSKAREKEVDDFIILYQSIFQRLPAGFRAPSHVIDQEGVRLLEDKGFLYDSSVVPHYPPFKKYRGYKGKAPLSPYQPKGLKILEIPVRGQVLGIPLAGAWIRGLPILFYRVLFSVYSPSFVTLSMHSWDGLYPGFLNKLEKIFKILKDKNYLFLNGEQILKNRG